MVIAIASRGIAPRLLDPRVAAVRRIVELRTQRDRFAERSAAADARLVTVQ